MALEGTTPTKQKKTSSAETKQSVFVDKDQIAREDNSMLIRRFVAAVGHDYSQDYAPHLYPTFSEDTVALWDEIESRLKEPRCVNFQRDACLSELREEVKKQDGILAGGPDYATSYHYGLRSGLNTAIGIVEKNILGADSNGNTQA